MRSEDPLKIIREILKDRGIAYSIRGNSMLLVRGYYPCPHYADMGKRERARHIHYYVVDDIQPYLQNPWRIISLLDWLECGFWCDSGIWAYPWTIREMLEKFSKITCVCQLTQL